MRSRETLGVLSLFIFCAGGGGVGVELLEAVWGAGGVVRCCCCAVVSLGVVWWALSREVTLVMPAVLTSREDTFRGGEVLTWRRVVGLKYK